MGGKKNKTQAEVIQFKRRAEVRRCERSWRTHLKKGGRRRKQMDVEVAKDFNSSKAG